MEHGQDGSRNCSTSDETQLNPRFHVQSIQLRKRPFLKGWTTRAVWQLNIRHFALDSPHSSPCAKLALSILANTYDGASRAGSQHHRSQIHPIRRPRYPCGRERLTPVNVRGMSDSLPPRLATEPLPHRDQHLPAPHG